ncbi:DNA topology modulation protein [Reinekea sp. G2M2-21]|uniref:DNA topology modulation protein n=1 Tax=Reinekea sp. G2M2-21 TaxID=2788942 RepID=UPI0018ABFE65|nr:DNA topology modulation protein [Reinekea sp. G2M2-21]
MKKIAIVGSGGAGKSTLARRLGYVLGLPVVHLDNHFWQRGWVETERSRWIEIQQGFVSQEEWIIDGNYGGTMDVRFAQADTIIYLNLSRYRCIWRAIKRRIMYHGKARPDMNNGCTERLDFQFLKWLWRYPRDTHPITWSHIEKVADRAQVIQLKTPGQVRLFLKDMTRVEQTDI